MSPRWGVLQGMAAVEESALPAVSRHLLTVIIRATNKERSMWAGGQRLAERTGMAHKTVKRHRAALERVGLITRTGHVRRATIWTVTWPFPVVTAERYNVALREVREGNILKPKRTQGPFGEGPQGPPIYTDDLSIKKINKKEPVVKQQHLLGLEPPEPAPAESRSEPQPDDWDRVIDHLAIRRPGARSFRRALGNGREVVRLLRMMPVSDVIRLIDLSYVSHANPHPLNRERGDGHPPLDTLRRHGVRYLENAPPPVERDVISWEDACAWADDGAPIGRVRAALAKTDRGWEVWASRLQRRERDQFKAAFVRVMGVL